MTYFYDTFGSFYNLLAIFLIYAFIGWCTEVAYAAVTTGEFINRGFLNGPICPIYGCGMVIVVATLTPIKDNVFVLFIGSMVLTTSLELLVGWGMDKIFHNQWWDYSDMPFNLKGYICLKFSIIWGFCCTFVMGAVHPSIFYLVNKFPHILGIVFLSLFYIAFVADLIITVNTVLKINNQLKILDEIDKKLDFISNSIGENIYEGTTKSMEISGKMKAELGEKKEELDRDIEEGKEKIRLEREELENMAREILARQNTLQRRIIAAFPDMKSRKYSASLYKLKDHLRVKMK